MGRTRHTARHREVLNRGAADFAEGGGALCRGLTDADGERISLAVERALEGMCLRADRCGHAGDVRAQLYVLAAGPVRRVVALRGEGIPLVFRADDIRFTGRSAASDVARVGLPLRIERHGRAVRGRQVAHALAGRVAGAGSIGGGVPSVEQLARVGERVDPQVLRHVVGERLAVHRARAAVGVVGHGVGVGRPLGVERHVASRRGRDAGDGRTAERRIVVPPAEGVARARRVGQRGYARALVVGRGVARRVGAAVQHVADVVGIDGRRVAEGDGEGADSHIHEVSCQRDGAGLAVVVRLIFLLITSVVALDVGDIVVRAAYRQCPITVKTRTRNS